MVFQFFSDLIQTLLSLIQHFGYLGVFIGMVIESSFFPFPSEVILIPAGTLVAQGQMNFFLVFFSGVLGSLVGAWINFFLAMYLGRTAVDLLIDKYGRFFFISKKQLAETDEYFKKHGDITTFVGRLILFVRQIISLPAGFARMNFWKFTLFTALGASIWTATLIAVGYFFGSNFNPVMKWVTGILLALSLVIVLVYYLFKRNKKK